MGGKVENGIGLQVTIGRVKGNTHGDLAVEVDLAISEE